MFADLSDYEVYRTLNAKNQLRAPTEFGVCLRPIRANVHGDGADAALAALKCLACESERARLCWITAMRLAKVITLKIDLIKLLFWFRKSIFVLNRKRAHCHSQKIGGNIVGFRKGVV